MTGRRRREEAVPGSAPDGWRLGMEGSFDEGRLKARVNAFPFVKTMGMRLVSCGGGKSVMRFRARRELMNTAGVLQGGVMGILADISVAAAVRSVLPDPYRMTTIEYKVNLLKPVAGGVVTAHGAVVRLGKTIAMGTSEVRDGEGKPVAFASVTFYLFEAPGAPGLMTGVKGAAGSARPRRSPPRGGSSPRGASRRATTPRSRATTSRSPGRRPAAGR